MSSKQGKRGGKEQRLILGAPCRGWGHPGWSGPILFHPPRLSLHTFPHPLLFSPSPKWYLRGVFLGTKVPFAMSHPANAVGTGATHNSPHAGGCCCPPALPG